VILFDLNWPKEYTFFCFKF